MNTVETSLYEFVGFGVEKLVAIGVEVSVTREKKRGERVFTAREKSFGYCLVASDKERGEGREQEREDGSEW